MVPAPGVSSNRRCRPAPRVFPLLVFVLAAIAACWTPAPATAQRVESPDLAAMVQSVVGVRAMVPSNARSAESLGTERSGSGVVIDSTGLIVTIGYLVMEASSVEVRNADGKTYPAEIVAYDQASGFGLLRGGYGFKAKPMRLGRSADVKVGDPMLALIHGGAEGVRATQLVSRREFAGYWEYLLDDALFTSPPVMEFGGAALVSPKGELIGVGSLFVHDAAPPLSMPGNMFIPVDVLRPILGDLIALGRNATPPRPWLGLTTNEEGDRLVIRKVTPGSPAETAGLRSNDAIVGVGGQPVSRLADLYRKIWALGEAGIRVPLDIRRGDRVETITVMSMDRYRHLRLNPTF
ncbi:S1C family serine protease [Skermanella aerolata]|uniref:S1C family serine protease n=1 Tax=Skermanella aerolata TaxID=393310 RepID=UPI0005E8F9A2|nr:S1C family serine protease [Skermanella aerolata]KJB93611.1 signal protein PDZ [Skermanella aerolata KACC 11604]